MTANTISLHDLEAIIQPGISKAWGGFLCEASITCLESQSHQTGVGLTVKGMKAPSLGLLWNRRPTSQTIASWNDDDEKVEYGAMGIACLLVLRLTKYTVIRRSKKGTGFDYWLGHKDSVVPLQDAARLEISGIMKGDNSKVNSRVKQKLAQSKPSDETRLPAIAVVVEFSKPISHIVTR